MPFFRSSLLLVPLLLPLAASAVGDEAADEQAAVAKIELLEGKLERDERQPGRPLVAISFGPKSRFHEQHLHLLRSCANLKTLDLRFVRTTDAGLETLRDLKKLTRLYLDPSRVTPAALSDYKRAMPGVSIIEEEAEERALKELFKRGTKIEVIVAAAPPMPVLEVRFHRNCSDADLTFVSQFDHLTNLELGNTQVTDTGLEEIAELKELRTLNLAKTKITDAGLRKLGGLKKLTVLNLGGTQITDAGLQHLKGFEHLTTLSLNDTKISDVGIQELTSLKQLETLNLMNTPLTDAIVRQLAELRSLAVLRFEGTRLTVAGLGELQESLPNLHFGY